ncbi:NAD(P)-binding protein [Lentinus tigrinus ALCF2SS1-6]|uniref:NAD(P)-binding protein n=1 Tax=Lentinus tigrinus ALCF2SS1-6 TaxID=1328759 RepID=A0A5C2SVI5_9APHY|nr:NAD(P)-binding protein [Lentinus tigrinus ALCF2SS1-6]
MSAKTTIFLTGATGYLGSSVLTRLLNHPDRKSLDITILVRDEAKATTFESKFGVKTVIGSHEDLDKVESAAEAAHVVFNISNADDTAFVGTILKGLKNRNTNTGDVPILIHTTGSAIVMDDARGAYPAGPDTIFDDLDVSKAKSIPPTAFHHNVDLLILDADTAGYMRGYLVDPSTVFGAPTNEIAVGGLANTHSIQIPVLIQAALARKRAGMVGEGKAIWPAIHVDDTADIFITLFDTIRTNPDAAGHGWNGYYNGENGEYTWAALAKAIGQALVELGVASDPEPTSFTQEELLKYFPSLEFAYVWGTNCRIRASRARALGWRPKYTIEDMMKSIKPEVETFLRK